LLRYDSATPKNEDTFISCLNQYVIAVCAPGGGESNTFERIISPVMEEIERISSKKISLEPYTNAGLQNHVIKGGGYAFITGDEGERFIATISQKQKQGEPERALLCKMWTGKGDSTCLSSGKRGFDKTSMSTCIFLQPYVVLHEMIQLCMDDGLLDRFMMCSCKPVFKPTSLLKQNMEMLNQSSMEDIFAIFVQMFNDHLDSNLVYMMKEDAQNYYNELVDNYARYIEEQYDSDNGKLKLLFNIFSATSFNFNFESNFFFYDSL
jgi:hypothetical protein